MSMTHARTIDSAGRLVIPKALRDELSISGGDSLPCRQFLASRPMSIAHVLVETYSLLTRLPAPQRVAPTVAADAIRRACAKSPATLPASAIAPLLSRLAHMGISGGAIYDALIAETARKHGITLYSLDRRARVTYDAVGADVVWIGTSG